MIYIFALITCWPSGHCDVTNRTFPTYETCVEARDTANVRIRAKQAADKGLVHYWMECGRILDRRWEIVK